MTQEPVRLILIDMYCCPVCHYRMHIEFKAPADQHETCRAACWHMNCVNFGVAFRIPLRTVEAFEALRHEESPRDRPDTVPTLGGD